MGNQIQVFNDPKFGDVHGYLDKSGTAYLNAADVARGLGFVEAKKFSTSGENYIRWERVNNYLKEFGYSQLVGKGDFLPENMVYRLAMKANNETARDFQAWLADEVVPSIRKTGGYSLQTINYKEIAISPKFLREMADALEAEQMKVAQLTEENAVLAQQVFEMTPKAKYYDLILQCPRAIPVTVIAKDYGMSPKKFNQLLHELGIQYKVGGVWVLYSYYENRGWTVGRTHTYTHKSTNLPDAAIHTYWTQQGRQGLYELLKIKGYLPLIELNDK